MTTTTIDLFGGTLMAPVPDPYSVYRRLRREQPVLRLRGWLGEENLITRHADIQAILRDPLTFSSRANAKAIGLVMGRTILEMEGRDHVRHRNLISPFFSARALKANHADAITSIAHGLIDGFAADGCADLVSQFTFTFPLRVLAQILDLPIEDFHDFHHRALELISIADNPIRGMAAAEWLRGYLRPLLSQRRSGNGRDLLSALVHGEVDGARIGEDEVLSFLLLLLPAGAETTYRLLGSLLFALLTHPEALAEVLTDRGAIDLAIDETLRWESPVQFVSRETTSQVSISGVELPPGEMLFLSLGSANRDEHRYTDPDRFDLHRAAGDHMAFGFGPHFCAGSHLARLEATIGLNALLDRLHHLRLDPDHPSQVVGLAFRSPEKLAVRYSR